MTFTTGYNTDIAIHKVKIVYKTYTKNGNPEDPLFIFAHGAGADSQSQFMTDMAERIAAFGVYVVRFDFPYMEKRREDGKKRPPDRGPKLIDDWQTVISDLDRPCVIGGKSMGGRIASIVAMAEDQSGLVKGCACLGYPFHPAGKPEKQRTEHLMKIGKPLLIVQGSRDTMGTFNDVSSYGIDREIEFEWLEDGNHDLKPRRVSGFSHEQHLQKTAERVAKFVKANQ